jgi:ribose transport system ATP-binding protein
MQNGNIIELRNMSKAFGGVPVLQEVNLTLRRGIVHGLIGGNGAGKSTLMKILSGIFQPDQGEIWINGKKTHLKIRPMRTVKAFILFPRNRLFPLSNR